MQGLESKSPQYNLTRDSALIVRLKPTNLDNIFYGHSISFSIIVVVQPSLLIK